MSLEAQLMTDLKEAMKTKNEPAKRSIRAVKAAILLTKTDGTGKELDAAGEIKLLQKLVKQRQESLDIYMKQGREDLAVVEREEIAVLTKYLPEQMSEDDIVKIVSEIITQVGASGMQDMGKVMGMASGKLAGKADGKTLAVVVKRLLTA